MLQALVIFGPTQVAPNQIARCFCINVGKCAGRLDKPII